MAAEDTFDEFGVGLTSPPPNHFAITPSDAEELPTVVREIYVGGSGDVELVDSGGVTCVYYACPAGLLLSGRFQQVKAANTTATHLIGRY